MRKENASDHHIMEGIKMQPPLYDVKKQCFDIFHTGKPEFPLHLRAGFSSAAADPSIDKDEST